MYQLLSEMIKVAGDIHVGVRSVHVTDMGTLFTLINLYGLLIDIDSESEFNEVKNL